MRFREIDFKFKNINLYFCEYLKMSNHEQLPLYLKFYKLTKVLYMITKNFPKQYKYTLGQSVLDLLWQCIDTILEINVLSDNKKYFKILELSTVLDKFKIRLRMAQEIGLISENQFSHIQINFVKEIGEMIGGWLRWSKKQVIALN